MFSALPYRFPRYESARYLASIVRWTEGQQGGARRLGWPRSKLLRLHIPLPHPVHPQLHVLALPDFVAETFHPAQGLAA